MATPAGALVDVTVRVSDEPDGVETIPARTTGVPGLVANRAPSGSGQWGITHQRSGLSIGFWTDDPELVVRFAHAIAHVVDWSASAAEIRDKVKTVAPEITRIGNELGLDYWPNPSSNPATDLDAQ